MELRYAGRLSLVVILSVVVSGTTARPITGFRCNTTDLTTTDAGVDPSTNVNSIGDAVQIPDHEILDTGELADPNLEDAGYTLEERMLALTAKDYNEPVNNPNPKHNP